MQFQAIFRYKLGAKIAKIRVRLPKSHVSRQTKFLPKNGFDSGKFPLLDSTGKI